MDDAVKQLLALKAEYKQATGEDYKPGAAPAQKAPTPVQSDVASAAGLFEKVAQQGELVRTLKAEKASKVSPKGVEVSKCTWRKLTPEHDLVKLGTIL